MDTIVRWIILLILFSTWIGNLLNKLVYYIFFIVRIVYTVLMYIFELLGLSDSGRILIFLMCFSIPIFIGYKIIKRFSIG